MPAERISTETGTSPARERAYDKYDNFCHTWSSINRGEGAPRATTPGCGQRQEPLAPQKSTVDSRSLLDHGVIVGACAHNRPRLSTDYSGLSAMKDPQIAVQEISLSAPTGAFEITRAAMS